MKDGQIAECGTHEQLMCKEREYANLFNSLQQEVRLSQHSNWISLHSSKSQKHHGPIERKTDISLLITGFAWLVPAKHG